VPDLRSELAEPMLVYDGSAQAAEALYVAAYLAGRWQLPLTVLCVDQDEDNAENQDWAQEYLDNHSVSAVCVQARDLDAQGILTRAAELRCDLLITGAYASNPVVGAVAGDWMTSLLSETNLPILICR
jgi:nucleotide-binding universal stress UspA family protein